MATKHGWLVMKRAIAVHKQSANLMQIPVGTLPGVNLCVMVPLSENLQVQNESSHSGRGGGQN